MIRLKTGGTNGFYLPGTEGGLLVDTGYAGLLGALYKALKAAGLRVRDIRYVMATHYHPDHMGLISGLTDQGVGLLLLDVQREQVHFSDRIFARDGIPVRPIDENRATVISCAQSRGFLAKMGIAGEIIHTPSHSPDSVCLLLDSGDALVGDLEPLYGLPAYGEHQPPQLRLDWQLVLSCQPRRILYAHAPEQTL